MSNNTHRVQNIFISDGTALPANNAAVTSVTAGKIGIYGQDMLALNPAGGDTITTQPFIYLLESKTDANGVNYLKKSFRIDGANVTKYSGQSYVPAKRQVWSIGYSRALAAGDIAVSNSTDYQFSIAFKNDKLMYSERQERLRVSFTSSSAATMSSIATQIVSGITGSAFKGQITAVKVGDGTGAYGLTGATNFGVEIWALDIAQYQNTQYAPRQVYFSVHVDDSTGFTSTTECAEIQAFSTGSGTYNDVYNYENFDYGYEGVLNRRLWPIPTLDYSSSATLFLSSAIAETSAGTTGEDSVTFSATVAAKIRAGEKVEIDGVNYEIKYFVSSTVAVLTSLLTTTNAAGAVKVRLKYDLVTIEFNDVVTTPTGVSAVAQKSVIIATPSINTAGAYNSLSTNGTDVKATLDAWMVTTPRAFAAISI